MSDGTRFRVLVVGTIRSGFPGFDLTAITVLLFLAFDYELIAMQFVFH